MASISSLGAGSGLFSSDLVDQLVNAERMPAENRLTQRQQTTEAKISAYGAIRSALEALKSPLEALSSGEGLKAFSSSSSNEGVATVSVDPANAGRGNYAVNVTQLAQSRSLASGEFADRDTTAMGTGTLTLSVGESSVDITIDDSNNTLEGMAEAINDANAGVTAGIVDTGSGYRLVLSSEETGTANAVQVSVSGDGDGNDTDGSGLSRFVFDGTTSNMEETVAAKDAKVEVNGISLTRSSNTVEGVIDGVSLDLKTVGTTTVKVERDEDAVADRVQAFVDKYNALQDVIKKASGFNSVSGTGGILSGDSAIRGIQSDMRGFLTSIPEGLQDSPVRMLADIGIKTDPSTGKLEFDATKFKEQLADHPDSVSALFAEQDGVEGIAGQTVSRLEDYLETGGILSNRTDGLNKTLEDIGTQWDQLDMRMASYEERLISQFSAADSLIAQLNSTGDYVSQQLAALAPNKSQS